jgi:DNA-binding SARP family transcriptional activator
MQVRLLGPVDVVVDGESRPVRGVRRGAVLAVVALHGGEVVSTGRLVDLVWGDAARPTAVNTLQAHVSYLRGVLGSKDAIRARPPGYVLDAGADGTDVQLAERLLRQGIRSADPVQGARVLGTALALWRGRPLADLAGLPWLEEQAERLELLGVEVKLALSEARLAAGEHLALVPGLEQLADERPLDEQIRAQLMLALYRGGRPADALAVYRRLRLTLDEELGIDPGHGLRDLEAAILRQDPGLDAPWTATSPPLTSPRVPTPAQLPSALSAFAGRDTELASLDAILPVADEADSGRPGAVIIAALSGTAGVGKTTLAVHWAHRVSARFPGGQLYVNLKGFGPGGEALDPSEAARGFLEAFGIPAVRIPADLPGRAGLYRSVLAGKQVLVVLDNARDVEQVRPLLPGSAGCLALVTSRNHLTGLVAAEGAHPLALELLSAADARDLLIRRLGASRVTREPAAVDDIITRCARLPLALSIAAARAATSPGFALAVFAAELREATRVLDPFDGGDLATDIRTVFSWSYGTLSPAAARLFRLLGLHPGPDIGLAAAASLAAIRPDQVRAPLAELIRPHQQGVQVTDDGRLVTRPGAGAVRAHSAGCRVGGRARASQCRRHWSGPPAGGVAGRQVTLVFQVPGERDHRGVEPGEMLFPAGGHVRAREAADLQRAEHGGDRHRDGDDRASRQRTRPRPSADCGPDEPPAPPASAARSAGGRARCRSSTASPFYGVP